MNYAYAFYSTTLEVQGKNPPILECKISSLRTKSKLLTCLHSVNTWSHPSIKPIPRYNQLLFNQLIYMQKVTLTWLASY